MLFLVVMYGYESWTIRKAEHQELLLNCDVGEDSWDSFVQQGDQTSPSWRRSTLNIHWRDDSQAEAPILWPPDVKNRLPRKDPDARKDWRQEEKRVTENEMTGWHHWLSGHKFDWALGDGEGQGSLMCCSSWGCKESDTTKRLNNEFVMQKSYDHLAD